MSENSGEEELEGMGVKGQSATTGARCGAVQQKEVKKGSRLVSRMQEQAGKDLQLKIESKEATILDETQDLGVVSCSSPEEGESWLEQVRTMSQVEPSLEARYQETGESLLSFYDAMQCWMKIAYPGPLRRGVGRDQLGRDAFLDGLIDKELAKEVRHTKPGDLKEAYQQATKMVEAQKMGPCYKDEKEMEEKMDETSPLTEVSELSEFDFASCPMADEVGCQVDGAGDSRIDDSVTVRRVKQVVVEALTDSEEERQMRLDYQAAWRDTTEEEKKSFDQNAQGKKAKVCTDCGKPAEESMMCIRRKGDWEPLKCYYETVEALVKEAYPQQKDTAREQIGMKAFLNGLPGKFAEEIRREGPMSLEGAYVIAVRLTVRQLTEGSNYGSEVACSSQTHRIVRPRNEGESLKAYHGVVRRFVKIAYPRNSIVGRDRVGKSMFLQGLQNPELYQRVVSFGPITLDEACAVAEYVEETMGYEQQVAERIDESIDQSQRSSQAEAEQQKSLQKFLDRGKKEKPVELQASPPIRGDRTQRFENMLQGASVQESEMPLQILNDVVQEVDDFLLSKWYRPQKKGEMVTQYQGEICRSVVRMYPRLSKVVRGRIGLGVFLEGLYDPRLSIRIRRRGPRDIATACMYACLEEKAMEEEEKRERQHRETLVTGAKIEPQRPGESLEEYAQTVRWGILVEYPTEAQGSLELKMVDAFLAGLREPQLMERVRRQRPRKLRDALFWANVERLGLLEEGVLQTDVVSENAWDRGQKKGETVADYSEAVQQAVLRTYPRQSDFARDRIGLDN